MSDEVISPGKSVEAADKDFHYHRISKLEVEFAQKGIDLCLAWYAARRDLDDKTFRQLAEDLKCSASARSKYVSGGSFYAKLPEQRKLLMPDSATTVYAIATASPEFREKAFNDGVITKDLKRDEWAAFVKENRARREAPQTLLRVFRPDDLTREPELLERLKKLAEDHSAKIDVPVEKLNKKTRNVEKRILEIADCNPKMSVEELVKLLDLKNAA